MRKIDARTYKAEIYAFAVSAAPLNVPLIFRMTEHLSQPIPAETVSKLSPSHFMRSLRPDSDYRLDAEDRAAYSSPSASKEMRGEKFQVVGALI